MRRRSAGAVGSACCCWVMLDGLVLGRYQPAGLGVRCRYGQEWPPPRYRQYAYLPCPHTCITCAQHPQPRLWRTHVPVLRCLLCCSLALAPCCSACTPRFPLPPGSSIANAVAPMTVGGLQAAQNAQAEYGCAAAEGVSASGGHVAAGCDAGGAGGGEGDAGGLEVLGEGMEECMLCMNECLCCVQ